MQGAERSKTDRENMDVVYETSDVMHETFPLRLIRRASSVC